MIRPSKTHLRTKLLLLALVIFVSIKSLGLIYRKSFQQINDTQPYGFEPVECWFGEASTLPLTECYYMHVPEDHAQLTNKTIAFPVVVFRSDFMFSTKAPVLHLGAGGPGASMFLDSLGMVEYIWESHNELSTNLGRDLFVIDPRGAGLSKPLLMCDVFIENEIKRLENDISFAERWEQERSDYIECIDKFKSQGVNVSTYHSLSIAHDIDMMRTASNLDEWVLVGVSYAATYAQIIATQYPDAIESMVLDSATFPNLKLHDNYLDKVMAGYLALYNYCSLRLSCTVPLENVENRIWNLYKALNLNPIMLELNHPYNNNKINVLLNGERFILSLFNGLYSEEIFDDLPDIIVGLEQGLVHTITPYIEGYIAFLLDPTFGDVSMVSHYCYEDEPYIETSA